MTLLGTFVLGALVESGLVPYAALVGDAVARNKIAGAAAGGISISLLILLVAGTVAALSGHRSDKTDPAD